MEIQNNGVEQAYNTTANGVFNNGNTDTHNHSITLGDVGIVSKSGMDYRQFLLDINEDGSIKTLSVDEIQLFVGGPSNPSSTSFSLGILTGVGTLVYQLDAGMDNWIKLDASNGSGGGAGDMFMYVLDSLFAAFDDDDIVTLYSRFGEQADPDNAGDGPEEWAYLTATGPPSPNPQEGVPEATSVLIWVGLASVCGYGASKRRRITA